METTITASLDDLLFQHRNRAYGAYQLRTTYSHRLNRALAFTCLFAGLLLAVPMVLQRLSPDVLPQKKIVIAHTIAIIQEPQVTIEPAPSEPAPQAPKPPTVRNLAYQVAPDVTVPNDPIPTDKELENAQSGPVTSPGDPKAKPEGPPVGEGGGGGLETVKPNPNPTYDFVEKMPAFGSDLNRYLGQHLRYPRAAEKMEVQGVVYVSFVVAPDGRVTEVQIARGVHPLLDEEAKRVIAALPNWQPGIQNKVAVPVRLVVPINFRITQ